MSKKNNLRLPVLLLVFTLLASLLLVSCCQPAQNNPNTPEETHVPEENNTSAPEETSYVSVIFDNTRVHTIDITMSQEDRYDQLAHPTDKTKYHADVVIDGEEIKDVSFHTKGNSSLFFVADAGKDKFSYGISFRIYRIANGKRATTTKWSTGFQNGTSVR